MKRKLQVFVSSTYLDLKEERQAAVSAILKAGHIPAGMELFTAGDRSQMKTIERWIEESDIYMLILGGRYGSIEAKTGISYTELEYDYAVEQGKRTFAIVIDEEALDERVKVLGRSILESENPKALTQFRSKVLTKMSAFFRDEKDVRLCVYESLSDFATDSSLKGWISASDVQDHGALIAEISNLKAENDELKGKIQNLEASPKASKPDRDGVDQELFDLLKSIKVKIPADITGNGKEAEGDLLNIAYGNRDVLTNGVTNRYDASAGETFYYFNVFPKLQVHGLADNEKVAGAKYRRSFLNKAGKAFFAAVERRIVRQNSQIPKSSNSTTNASDAKTDVGVSARKKRSTPPKKGA